MAETKITPQVVSIAKAGSAGISGAATLTGGTNITLTQSGQDISISASGAVATDTIFDAKGDLAVGTGADTASKLTVGANDTVLVAASGEATGAKWSATLAGLTLTSPIISSISNTGTLTLPTSTDTLVGKATTDTLTNKTIASHLAYADTRFYVGSFTYDISTASGTQAITGVGFTPVAVIFMGSVNNVAGQASWGFDTLTGRQNMYDNYARTANTYGIDAAASITVMNTGVPDYVNGQISAFGADGFTITWTKANSPTGTLTCRFLALR